MKTRLHPSPILRGKMHGKRWKDFEVWCLKIAEWRLDQWAAGGLSDKEVIQKLKRLGIHVAPYDLPKLKQKKAR